MGKNLLGYEPFIYLFEANADGSNRAIAMRRTMLSRGDELLTSWLTVGEAITKPKETGNSILEKSYLNFFLGGSLQVIAFDSGAAQRYGDIRSRSRVKPADSIQLACAAAAGTDLFVTNDSRLSQLVVPGITFITSLERIPY